MKIEMMIFATLLLSQMAQAQSLPDEIDNVNYRAVMQKSLDESNALRGKANVIQSQIANLELQISKNQDLIQFSNARIELQILDTFLFCFLRLHIPIRMGRTISLKCHHY